MLSSSLYMHLKRKKTKTRLVSEPQVFVVVRFKKGIKAGNYITRIFLFWKGTVFYLIEKHVVTQINYVLYFDRKNDQCKTDIQK